MANEDGLLDNPNLTEDPAQQSAATLTEIKQDTSAIREAIYQFGGAEIEQAKKLEKQVQSQQQQQNKHNKTLSEAVQLGVVSALKTTKKNALKANSSKQQPPLNAPKSKQADSQKTATTEKTKSSRKPPQLSTPKREEKLPNGWKRDRDGRVRDRSGQYVSEKALRKHHIKNPNSNAASSAEDTQDEQKQRQVLDALDGIKDSIEAENLDPIINATQELSSPIKAIFGVGKASTEIMGRGLGKIFHANNGENKERRRFFRLFRKANKEGEKRENRMLGWLQRIWKKDDKGGWLAKLLMIFAFIPKIISRLLPRMLGRGLGTMFARIGLAKLFRNAFSGVGKFFSQIFSKAKGILASLGKGLSSLFGKGKGLFGALGKGLLKRLPIIGSLMAFADGGLAGGIGAIVGGALGTAFGPIGTILGGIFGEKIGVWLAGLDWKSIGERISSVWQATTQALTNIWNSTLAPAWNAATAWISSGWDSLKNSLLKKWESATQSFTDIWQSIQQWFANLIPDWIKDGASKTVDNIKSYAGSAVEKAKELGSQAWDKTKSTATKAKAWATDKAEQIADWGKGTFQSASNWLGGLFGATPAQPTTAKVDSAQEPITPLENSLEQANQYQENTEVNTRIEASAQSETNDYLGNILTTLNDILAWLKDKLNSFTGFGAASNYALNPDGTPMQTGAPHFAYTGEGIEGLNQAQTAALLGATAQRESGNNHRAENDFGYIGAYQFGADALSDMGVVNQQKWQAFKAQNKNLYKGGKHQSAHAKFLADPSNWTIQGGKEAFLNDRALQDKVMVEFTNRNAKTLTKHGVYGGDVAHKAGLLLASHLKGAGNAIKFAKNGTDAKDAYGTSVSSYYQLGKTAVNKAPLNPEAENLEQITAVAPPQLAQPTQFSHIKPFEYHQRIPKVETPKPVNYVEIRQQAEKVIAAAKPPTEKSAPTAVASAGIDPIFQFLTQDVSERRIAHIVTGGLVRADRN